LRDYPDAKFLMAFLSLSLVLIA